MKIFVAIPVYDGKLPIEVIRGLMNEQAVALGIGDEFVVNFLSSDAGIAGARNTLSYEFMESGFDRLVFLDSDITCKPGDLVKLAHAKVDFIGGCYRYKSKDEKYPINWMDKPELWADENGYLEVSSLPTGFLSLSRNVFEVLKNAHPERTYEHCGRKNFCYFQMMFKDGYFYGEDILFCQEWREAGGKVYLNPEIELTHWQHNEPTPHVGHIGNWLKNRPTEAVGTRALDGMQIDVTKLFQPENKGAQNVP